MTATHWVLTYVTQDGVRFQESTRAAGMGPVTEADMKEGLASVMADAARRGGLPATYVQDQLRGGQPTLIFLGRLSHVELQPDPDPDPEVQRHLELVLTDPGQAGPDHGEPVDPHQVRSGPPEPQDLFTNLVPAGPRRFA